MQHANQACTYKKQSECKITLYAARVTRAYIRYCLSSEAETVFDIFYDFIYALRKEILKNDLDLKIFIAKEET